MKRNGTTAAFVRVLSRSRGPFAVALVVAPVLAGAWLFAAALPALADGGPHVAANNSGASTLTADSCAGCHRAHTAQGQMLLTVDEEALCLTCHGTDGKGASTNVEDGVQYATANDGSFGGDTGPIIGALRSGGFVNARINSGDPYRAAVTGSLNINVPTKVSVLGAGQPVTSAHLNTTENGLTAPTVAWGNGAISGTPNPGPTVAIGCATCHNPHGNGQYRILNPIPAADGLTPGAAANVTDYLVNGAVPAGVRNYTVIQTDAAGNRIYLASDVIAVGNPTAGDYWHRRVPWNAPSSQPNTNDAPNGLPDSNAGFPFQITSWCSTCHTRYMHSGESGELSGDAIFNGRHATTGSRACTTCHVAHGSNANMPGDPTLGTAYSKDFPYPDGTTTSGSSRLLKVDNRGTCQLCHNPTGVAVPARGTVPTPALP